jgi:hypothetical protein
MRANFREFHFLFEKRYLFKNKTVSVKKGVCSDRIVTTISTAFISRVKFGIVPTIEKI